MPKKDAKSKEDSSEETGEEGREEASDAGEAGVLEEGVVGSKEPTEKEKLLALYQTLKDLGINSIGDLEVKIARLS